MPFDVIMLDEVHERGRNVDICIALLSLKLENPLEKFKLILCSACVDEQIANKFKNVSNFTIEIPNNKVTEHEYLDCHPIFLMNELSSQLRGEEQILCFLASVNEVKEATEIFKKEYKKQAYPLFAN